MRFRKIIFLLVYLSGTCSGCNFFKDSGIVWEFKTGYPLVTSPVVSGPYVYFGSDKFYCLNADTGKPVWEFNTYGIIQSPAEVRDGYVYFQCGGLYCLDAATGKTVWEFWTDTWGDLKPVISDERIYTIIKGKAYCLDASKGQKLWDAAVNTTSSAPAAADDYVYIGSEGRLFALDAGTGKNMWVSPIGEKDERLHLQALHGKVYAGSFGTKFYCVDGASGKMLWTYTAEPMTGFFSLSGDKAYLCADKIYCLNADTGKPVWESAPASPVIGRPVISDNFMYIKSLGGRLNCIDLKTGEQKWDIKAPGPGVIARGYLYTGSLDSKVYCRRLPKEKQGLK